MEEETEVGGRPLPGERGLMLLFLLVYLAVYGGMHCYVFWKCRRAWPAMSWRTGSPLGAFLALMVLTPILERSLDRAGFFGAARAVALVGSPWIAIAFWFFTFGLLLDAWNLLVMAASHAHADVHRLFVSPTLAVCLLALLAGCGTIWGLFEAASIRTVELTVESERMAPDAAPLKIVHISDLHLGLLVREGFLDDVIRLVQQAQPDVLVSTGDLLDASGSHVDALAERLADVRPPLGKFAVFGNHEFYAGADKSMDFHQKAGFTVLRGEPVVVGDRLVVAGVDDPAGGHVGQRTYLNAADALPEDSEDMPVVLLKHQPVPAQEAAGRFDLQLSGHTHGGQIFPFSLLVRLAHPYWAGEYSLPGNSTMYVSRGTGTWGPPMRVFAPPEITVIEMRPARRPAAQQP